MSQTAALPARPDLATDLATGPHIGALVPLAIALLMAAATLSGVPHRPPWQVV
jgi:hypothetical protein